MMAKTQSLAMLMFSGSLIACSVEPVDSSDPQVGDTQGPGESTVVAWARDGSPTFIVGELAKVQPLTGELEQARTILAAALPPLLKPFRLTIDDLVARKISTDDQGEHHIRYQLMHEGLPVIGGDLVVHVDRKGAIVGINGTARGDLPTTLGAHPISEARALAAVTNDKRFIGMTASATRSVFIQTRDDEFHKALEATVIGQRGKDPVRDLVYVDVDSGAIVADYPQIHFAETRKVYSANNGTLLPGALMRSEGDVASTDVDVNAAYDGTGDAWEAYNSFFNRDSYDNAGAQLLSSVHYSTSYCNAYWDGISQMVYGDGDPTQNCLPLARGIDVTAHELTHAVTTSESGLVYSGESGGMNESTSDIFGAFVEAWTDGGKTGVLTPSTNTWLVGEVVLPPAIRWMCDPATDGASADVWSSSVGNLDVHYSSGVGNLAFCLLTTGGTHPRGKTTMVVPAIGMDKAIRIFYKANVDYLTPTSNYVSWRTATEQATTALGYDDATRTAVSCAWEAVKVGSTGQCPGDGTGTGSGDTTLANGVAVTGQAGALHAQTFYKIVVPAGQTSLVFNISGGTGDADLYTQFGVHPTTTSYTCRPYVNGNTETCTLTNPAAGTYYAMLNAYAAYTGVAIKATYTSAAIGDPLLLNGVAVTSISGAVGSAQYWRVTTPAAHTLKVTISGGTGDADLYVRSGSRPTTTTYACRPYTSGNNETCTISNTVAGDYYVMVRGYAAFTGVTLKATY